MTNFLSQAVSNTCLLREDFENSINIRSDFTFHRLMLHIRMGILLNVKLALLCYWTAWKYDFEQLIALCKHCV